MATIVFPESAFVVRIVAHFIYQLTVTARDSSADLAGLFLFSLWSAIWMKRSCPDVPLPTGIVQTIQGEKQDFVPFRVSRNIEHR